MKLYNQIALLMAQADDELRVKVGDEDRWDFLQNAIAPEEMPIALIVGRSGPCHQHTSMVGREILAVFRIWPFKLL